MNDTTAPICSTSRNATSEASDFARSRAGDTAAFEQLVVQHQRIVVATAYARTHDTALAHDLAQEAFLLAWRKLSTIKERALRSYLLSTVRKLAANARRKRKEAELTDDEQTSQLSDDHVGPYAALAFRQDVELLHRALAELPEILSVALILYYQEEQSLREVARALQVSSDTAKQRIHRGRKRLRCEMSRFMGRELSESRITNPQHFAAGISMTLPTLSLAGQGAAGTTGAGGVTAKAFSWPSIGMCLAGAALVVIAAVAVQTLRLSSDSDGTSKRADLASLAPEAGAAGDSASKLARRLPAREDNDSADVASPLRAVIAGESDGPSWNADEMPRSDGEMASLWAELPLATGLLKIYQGQVDLDGDGSLSSDEILDYLPEQQTIFAELVELVWAERDKLQPQPLKTEMRRFLRESLEDAGLVASGRLTVDFEIYAPILQGENSYGNEHPLRRPKKFRKRGAGSVVLFEQEHALKTAQLLVRGHKGQSLRTLLDTIRYSVAPETTDSLCISCEAVFLHHGELSQRRLRVAVPFERENFDDASAQLEHALNEFGQGICVDFEVQWMHGSGGQYESGAPWPYSPMPIRVEPQGWDELTILAIRVDEGIVELKEGAPLSRVVAPEGVPSSRRQ